MTTHQSPSDLLIEKYLLGELNQIDRERLESDPEFPAVMQKLQNSNREILAQYPAGRIAELIRKKSFRAIPRAIVAWPSLAIAAMVCVVLGSTFLLKPANEIRLKGPSALFNIYLQKGATFEPLVDGSAVHEHDRVQIGYRSGGAKYGVLFSIDGNHKTTVHFPDDVAGAGKLVPGGEILLPHSFEFDEIPSFEKFVFLTADEPFDVNRTIEQYDKALPKYVRAFSITLKKVR